MSQILECSQSEETTHITPLSLKFNTDHITDEAEENLSEDPSYAMEMLESLTSLLDHDAHDPLLITVEGDAHNVDNRGSSADTRDYHNDPMELSKDLPLNLTGLAAVLHAAHMGVTTNKDAEDGRDGARSSSPSSRFRTKTTPAFQSLNVSQSSSHFPMNSDGKSSNTAYVVSDDDGNSSDEIRVEKIQRFLPRNQSTSVLENPLSTPDNLDDFSDILAHLTAELADETVVTSPVASMTSDANVSHSPTSPPAPLIVHPMSNIVPYYASYTIPSVQSQSVKKLKKGKGKAVTPKNEHICDFCSKNFNRKSDMIRHARIHTGDRPFVCEYEGCGKTFIQRSALQVHERVHTGERPHACEFPGCGRTFGDSSGLARHRRTHTGNRTYRCEFQACGKAFTRRNTLNTHMRGHDPNWEPISKDLKTKRRKVGDDDDRSLEESVRTLTTLFGSAGVDAVLASGSAAAESPLDSRVAALSAEIAAVLAQAQSRLLDAEDSDTDDDETEGEEDEVELLGPTTSGIRDEIQDGNSESDDFDDFRIPLRVRSTVSSQTETGTEKTTNELKRKR